MNPKDLLPRQRRIVALSVFFSFTEWLDATSKLAATSTILRSRSNAQELRENIEQVRLELDEAAIKHHVENDTLLAQLSQLFQSLEDRLDDVLEETANDVQEGGE